jgi:hypothetical protein
MTHKFNEYDAHASLVQWASEVEKHKKALNAMAVSRFRKQDSKAYSLISWIVLIATVSSIGMLLAY